jgi:paraquat-inducible protein B
MRNLILTLMIWVICFTGITVGASLSYTWYKNRGKNICISFKEVDGLVPDQSKIMFKGVQIGTVHDINLDLKTGDPIVVARIDKEPAKLIGKNSSFWIVRPEIGLGEIRNLSAIATGDYIEVNPVPGEDADHFVALEDDPVQEKFESGLKIILKSSSSAGIEVGSKILYRDFKIGQVGDMDLSKTKRYVLITVYIDKLYTDVIRKNSSFANVSGFHASIHIFGGSEISLNSLDSLINGAITVTTPNFNSAPAKNNDIFPLLTKEEYVELNKCN